MGPFYVIRFLKLLAAGVTGAATGVWLLANPNLGMRDAPPRRPPTTCPGWARWPSASSF
ncbi:MAG TPA: hypothetical protein VKD90_15850 [Gemmataceae bacterium]|nr:hypothetical protein [Gemmataceae bacterium]